MLISMTGYGQALAEIDQYKVSVEMKSVNHRFSEVNIRMPRQFLFVEEQLKKMVSRYVKRGKVDVFITMEGDDLVEKSFEVNWDLFDEFHQLHMQAQAKLKQKRELSAEQLLLHPDITTIREKETRSETLVRQLLNTTEQAAQELFLMRQNEGKSLSEDLISRINNVISITDNIAIKAPTVVNDYRHRLLKRMEDFIAGKCDIDEARLMNEVAVFCDKANIEEELIRLQSHSKQFLSIINQQDSVVGRKLDFLVQEMNREINTIGSKANDIHISTQVVELKAELEKIREQVQNIE